MKIGFKSAIMCLLVATTACTSAPPLMVSTSKSPTESYALAAGDKLRITVYGETALTGEYAINAAGNVAMPLVGDIPVNGKGVEELGEAIRAKLAAGYVKDPRVSVEVLNYRPYYILGEVTRPGEFPYSVNLSVEQAVAAAGGYTYRANTKVAFLRRKGDDVEHSVKLRGAPTYVLPGDTIRIGQRYF